ncbi:MAG: histidine phosphatase family protein [Chloroflexi bacterium]|nr:histidine phosphatase family protein [Chloroflexota bacterium]
MGEKMTRIILVRHGQTEWNRVERFRGRADVGLNQTGLIQAQAVARRLRAEGSLVAVYSSPLSRSLETARPIAEMFGLAVQHLAGLIDIDYGEWQGLTPEEVAAKYAALYHCWQEKPHLAQIPGGENLGQVRQRVVAALNEAIARHPGQTIVLVSHKVICKVLLCAVLGLDDSHFWRIEQDNGAINIIEYQDGVFTIRLVNDTCHL